jgi:hypothetical protein
MTVTTDPQAAGIGGGFARHAYPNPSRSALAREPLTLGILHAESDGRAKRFPFTFVLHESESKNTRLEMQIRNSRLIDLKILS